MTSLHLRIGILCSTILFNFSSPCAGKDLPKESFIKAKEQTISFTENKGQVHDQNNQSRPDVLFSGTDGQMVFHLKSTGISYQLNRIDSWKEEETFTTNKKQGRKIPDQSSIYRIDINWLNTNEHITMQKSEPIEGFTNYYLQNCPDGALNVKSYGWLLYKQLYNGIDLKWYTSGGRLKYDFIVAAGADYKQIQLKIGGSEKLSVNKRGELIIQTPFGTIVEAAPLVTQNGRVLTSKWDLHQNILSLIIKNHDPLQELIIDPIVRAWGTYYGGTLLDDVTFCTLDDLGNVFLSGYTWGSGGTSLATSGSHQSTFMGVGDAFLVKFNPAGVRIWGTYYGGAGDDSGYSCSTDSQGNVYMTGSTTTSVGTSMATVGSHQPSIGGSENAFLVKFNGLGVRQWGTYYGGIGLTKGICCKADSSGNVFMVGVTNSFGGASIATAGSHQTLIGGGQDAFLVKFDPAGVRQWSSYYGGTGDDFAKGCNIDKLGNLYLTGFTASIGGTGIATGLSHQAAYGGGTYDAFLVKFNPAGVRQWGTYYGGADDDIGFYCSFDTLNNVYLAGVTGSSGGTIIATPGSHQTALAAPPVGGFDAFLVKFNSVGVRQWGTYYGGVGAEDRVSVATDTLGNVYIAGRTVASGSLAIATPGSYQSTQSNTTQSSFLVNFNSSGVRQWGTYYGGVSNNYGLACAVDPSSQAVYLAGVTFLTSGVGTSIASATSHQPTYGGGSSDVFLVKFIDCVLPSSPNNITAPANLIVCGTGSGTLSASGTGTINWYTSSTSQSAIATGTAFVTPNLSIGTYTYYVADNTCAPSASRTAIILTVSPMPLVNAYSTNSLTCAGQNVAIASNGASSYTWFPGNLNGSLIFVTPSVTTSYTVYGSLGGICQNSAVVTQSIVANPSISVNSGTLCSGNIFTIQPLGANIYTIEGGSALVSPLVNTSYTVSGALNSGCLSANIATCIVTVLQSPTVSASASPTLICPGESSILNASGGLSYTWTPAVPLTSIVNPLSTVNYSLSVSGSNACISTSVITISVDACVGLNTQSENEASIQIYPNPNAGIFTIELKEGASFSVYDVLGKRLFSKNLIAGKQIMNLSNFANGIYYLKIESKNQSKNLKLIKE